MHCEYASQVQFLQPSEEQIVNTPWGKSDSKITLARGISFVTTPSHGGFAVTPTAALQYLSTAAVSRGKKYGGYYFFEEDCDASIVLFELPQALRLKWSTGVPIKEELIKSLSRWHADYLIEVGQEPDAEGLKYFNENKQQDRMRADRSPDLIVAAFGDWAPWVEKGCVGVMTADGASWLVKASEYDNRADLNLLSNYAAVKAVR
jgi:hypothetical protein